MSVIFISSKFSLLKFDWANYINHRGTSHNNGVYKAFKWCLTHPQNQIASGKDCVDKMSEEMQVGHSVHTMPGEFIIGGFPMAELQSPRETLEKLRDGQGPEYEVLVATYPRSGQCPCSAFRWPCNWAIPWEMKPRLKNFKLIQCGPVLCHILGKTF